MDTKTSHHLQIIILIIIIKTLKILSIVLSWRAFFFFLAVPEHPDHAPWAESWTADALILGLAAGEGSIFPLPSKVTELQILGFSE